MYFNYLRHQRVNPSPHTCIDMSLSERIQDVLGLLQHHRISPFDLVLELLDESKPQYSFYRTEFYKEGNEKLSQFLNAIITRLAE